ncbi:MAG TPA: hypothetical protein VEI01_16895 [Terriglobales bacterium]|nr:hypothetical protein [Terriglobales bacterium]
MNEHRNLIASGLAIVRRHKRYLVWLWLLNLALAFLGVAGLGNRLHPILDHSRYADKLLHGFDAAVYLELVARPEMGPETASTAPAVPFAFLFFLLTLLFLPGVLLAYTGEHRLPREAFFRVCERSLWRFIRLIFFFAIIAVPVVAALFSLHHALVKAAEKDMNELLPFYTMIATLGLIALVMTFLRIWFDLAEVDVVLRDQNMVRKSVASAWRHSWRSLGRLLGSYMVIAAAACLVLVIGIWVWHVVVPPANVVGAFVVSQAILIALLGMRFWQRASAAAFYMREMFVPSVANPPASAPPLSPPDLPSPGRELARES